MNPKQLGAFVREKREKKKLTQAEISALLGYQSTMFISLIERGESKVPFKTLGELSVILDFKPGPIVTSLLKDYRERLEDEITTGVANRLAKNDK
jgi:transcriptional regulator with XRE-family HTH domain